MGAGHGSVKHSTTHKEAPYIKELSMPRLGKPILDVKINLFWYIMLLSYNDMQESKTILNKLKSSH
jgi:hypothetical protein